jgi:electron transport complex protein RnfC
MKTLRALFSPRGGIHPRYSKDATAALPIEKLPPPATALVSVVQHLGAPAKPIVKKGDAVLAGQPVAEPGAFVSAWIHSPVSGTVKGISNRVIATNTVAAVIEIESDGQDRTAEPMPPMPDWASAQPAALVERVMKAGIVGMGGAGFPTHVKISPPPGKAIRTLIINGAECEPYLTADHRLMVEEAERVWTGTRILQRILGAAAVRVAIEDNKPDAVAAMQKVMAGAEGDVELVTLKTLYPQGAEKQQIYSITGKEVPSGGLPMDVGCLVENVGTAAAIADAVLLGKPLIERVITVTGSGVARPKNLLARLGTPFHDLITACGGTRGDTGKVICGGPLMGVAQTSPDAAMTKTSSGLLILPRKETANYLALPCISCGRCVAACPSGLLPCTLSEAMEVENLDLAEQLCVTDCIECGCCAYECPSRRPLVQHMRKGKAAVLARRRQREEKLKKEKAAP